MTQDTSRNFWKKVKFVKNKFKYIACFVLIIITICLSTISAFGAGYYQEYDNEDTGESEYFAFSNSTPILPIESMTIYSNRNGVKTKRTIEFQKNVTIQHSVYRQLFPYSSDTLNGTDTYTSTNSGIGSLRNMTKLKGLFVEKNSQLYNQIKLSLYDDTWQDIIRYSLPSTGISAIRTAGFHSNGSLELPINEIIFTWYPEETVNGKTGRYFKIDISTELGNFLFIDTKNDVFRNEFAIWSFRYGYENPDNDFITFVNKVYPLPENLNTNWIGNPDNFVINDIVKNHIVFNLLAYATTSYPTVSRIKLTATPIYYEWNTIDMIPHYGGDGASQVLSLSFSDPFFLRFVTHIEYKFSPFIVESLEDMRYLSENAPTLRKYSYLDFNGSVEADISVIAPFDRLIQENNNGEISEFYNYKGIWNQTQRYFQSTETGKLFFEDFAALDFNTSIQFGDIHYEYRYNDNPQPIYISNMTVTQNIFAWEDLPEHEYYGQLIYDVQYYDNPIAKTNITKYFENNTSFSGDNLQQYYRNDRNDFNVPPPEPWNLGDFFDGVLSFFNDPILGPFSIANILYVVIAIGVLFAVLKYFAGG